MHEQQRLVFGSKAINSALCSLAHYLVSERKHHFLPGMFLDLAPKPLFGTRPRTPQHLFSPSIRALSRVGTLNDDVAIDS